MGGTGPENPPYRASEPPSARRLTRDDEIGARLGCFDQHGIRSIDRPRPRFRGLRRTAVPLVAVDQPSKSLLLGRLAEPDFGNETANVRPRRLIDEQIVALGDHDASRRGNSNVASDALVHVPNQARRLHGVVRPGHKPAQQSDETLPIKHVDGALAVVNTEAIESRDGEVWPSIGR